MGEAKSKSRNLDALLKGASRCIYCENVPETIEHMPPRSLFSDKKRPSGLEFPSCKECNNETKGADAAASFFSRLSRTSDDTAFWRSARGEALIASVVRDAPGLYSELVKQGNPRAAWGRTYGGILQPIVLMRSGGPITKKYLDVFSAKLGMALYAEHVGEPLPQGGLVQATWFANAGLNNDQAASILTILPTSGELRQGRFEVRTQFSYRYNTDQKTIVAGLVGMHSNLHVFFIASGTPDIYKLPMVTPFGQESTSVTRPGDLIKMLCAS